MTTSDGQIPQKWKSPWAIVTSSGKL